MSTFLCTECDATFEGGLVEVSAGAYEHSTEHADSVTAGKNERVPRVTP